MTLRLTRRELLLVAVASAAARPARAAGRDIWSAEEARAALEKGEIVMIDVRSRKEWRDTGVAEGAWAISMHEPNFPERLFAARKKAGGRPVALICAVGGRTGYLMEALGKAGYSDFVDVSEGMMGSRRGPGWIARKYPVVDLDTALGALPADLR